MADKSQTAGLASNRAWFLHLAWLEFEQCDAAIRQYAEAGISGTPHDIEHHQMRDRALVAVSRIMKELEHAI